MHDFKIAYFLSLLNCSPLLLLPQVVRAAFLRRPIWKFECLVEDVKEELQLAAEKALNSIDSIGSSSSSSGATEGGTDVHKNGDDDDDDDVGENDARDKDSGDDEEDDQDDDDEEEDDDISVQYAKALLNRHRHSHHKKKLTPEEVKLWLGCDPTKDVRECIQV
jgi:hypothetical protein